MKWRFRSGIFGGYTDSAYGRHAMKKNGKTHSSVPCTSSSLMFWGFAGVTATCHNINIGRSCPSNGLCTAFSQVICIGGMNDLLEPPCTWNIRFIHKNEQTGKCFVAFYALFIILYIIWFGESEWLLSCARDASYQPAHITCMCVFR